MDHETFQQQTTRDLAWLITSPSYISGGGRGNRSVSDQWLQQAFLDSLSTLNQADQQNALSSLAPHPQQPFRLGRYAEDLLEWWLSRWPECSQLVRGLQVSDGKRTIGEFDFLWFDQRQQLIHHWELAVKFYLQSAAKQDLKLWIGPHPDDNLGHKLDLLWNQQLTLPHTKAGKQAMSQLFPRAATVESRAILKGYVYYPAADWPLCNPIPRGLSADHAKGWWCHMGQVKDQLPQDRRTSRWLNLPKSEWLAPARRPNKSADLIARGQMVDLIQTHFQTHMHPLHLAEMRPGIDGFWHERSRGFVVHNQWPDMTTQPSSQD